MKKYFSQLNFLLILLFCNLTVFSQSPQLEWVKSMGGTSMDYPNSSTIDKFGNIYITGIYQEQGDYNPSETSEDTCILTVVDSVDFFILKLDANGQLLWAKSFGGVSNDYGMSIDVDMVGNVYCCGYFSETADFDPSPTNEYLITSNGWADCFILKLDTDGNFEWAKNVGTIYHEYAYTLKASESGNVYIGGRMFGIVDLNPSPTEVCNVGIHDQNLSFLLKLDTDGEFVFANAIQPMSNQALDIDESENIYLGGYFSGTQDFDPSSEEYIMTAQGSEDGFFMKLDNNGEFIWAKQLLSEIQSECNTIAVDKQGKITIGGFFEGSFDLNTDTEITDIFTSEENINGFLAKYDANGSYLWGKQFNCDYTSEILSCYPDSIGNIYFCGEYWGDMDMDPGTPENNVTSVALLDLFFGKLNSTGGFEWGFSFGGPSYDRATTIIYDNNSVYVSGNYSYSVDFNFDPDESLILTGESDVFVYKLNEQSTNIMSDEKVDQVLLYPNPAQKQLCIRFDEKLTNASINISDIHGKKVLTKTTVNDNLLTIDVEHLPKGMYFIELRNNTITNNYKFIKE